MRTQTHVLNLPEVQGANMAIDRVGHTLLLSREDKVGQLCMQIEQWGSLPYVSIKYSDCGEPERKIWFALPHDIPTLREIGADVIEDILPAMVGQELLLEFPKTGVSVSGKVFECHQCVGMTALVVTYHFRQLQS